MKYGKSFVVTLLLAFIGVILSFKLLLIDYNILFSNNYTPECDISQQVSCSAVAQSSYAFLFKIPVASIGLLAYILVIIYMLINRKKNILFSLMIIYSVLSIGSLYYFGVSKLILNTICLYCTGTYIVNWISTIVIIFANIKYRKEKEMNNELKDFKPEYGITPMTLPIYILIALVILIPSFVIFNPKVETKAAEQPKPTQAQSQQPSAIGQVSKPNVKTEGYPNGGFDSSTMTATAGDFNAKVTVILFSDYECPFCDEFEKHIKKILKNVSGVKVIRKEFPLDNTCNPILEKRQMHPDACSAAYFAKCAGVQNKFWEACDILHSHKENLSSQYLQTYAKELNLNINELNTCMKSTQTKEAISKEIKEGIDLGVRGTPGYIINGDKYKGLPQYENLEKAIVMYGGVLKSPVPSEVKN